MATESASTNGQRMGQQATGDGGQASRGGQSAGSQEQRSPALASREPGAGTATPFTRFDQNPFASLWQISREMDRLMDSFFGGGLASAGEPRYGMSSGWTPRIEVRQRDESLLIHVDLPGVKQEDVQIEATEDGLAISGERQQQREENEEGFRRSERVYGSFYRLIPLPDGARVDDAKASMHNGVLEVTVPLERTKPRRIKIEGGPSRA